MDTIFDRKPFTDWIIVVKDRYLDKYQEVQYAKGSLDFNEFTATYRTGWANGKECEIFTLMALDAEYAYLWVHIYKNGNIEYVSHIPSVITTDKKKKRIEILPMVHCKYRPEHRTFEFSYVDDYRSGYDYVFK